MSELHAEETTHPPRANGHAPVPFDKLLATNETTTFSMFRQMGDSGLKQSGGFITEEFLRELQGPAAARVFREMADNSSAVGSLLFAIGQVIRRVEWHAVPKEEGSTEAEDMAAFADELRDDMDETWEEFIIELLSMLVYGYAPMEIVLKRRDDGRIGIRSLPLRGQDSIQQWDFGPSGEVNGLFQQPWTGPTLYLPAKKFLLFRPGHVKNNPEGRSILRSAYRPWYFLKVLEEQQAILFSRVTGMPVVYIPEQIGRDAANGDAIAVAQLAAWKKLVTRTRVNDQMGMVLYSDCYLDDQGKLTTVPKYKFEFATPQNRTQADYEAARKSYRVEILASVLADFIDLGHDSRGTQALGVSKVDLFLSACEGWLKAAAAVLNRDLLPLIWRMNGLNEEMMPEYVPEMPRQADVDAMSAAVLRYSQAGMPFFPDMETENVIRRDLGLPEAPEEGIPMPAMQPAGGPQDASGDGQPVDGGGAAGAAGAMG